jgi:hypothetical protein
VTPSLKIEVDQSGKIETPHVTALAYSNGKHYAILIPTRVKREVIGRLRARGHSRSLAAIRLFAAALWLLLQDVSDTATEITIDTEYSGHEADIKAALLRMAWKRGSKIEAHTIVFTAIGKKSGAHKRAIGVYRGELHADRLITVGDLLALLEK